MRRAWFSRDRGDLAPPGDARRFPREAVGDFRSPRPWEFDMSPAFMPFSAVCLGSGTVRDVEFFLAGNRAAIR